MADTSVPQPSFGDRGFVAPTEAEILAGIQADIDGAFGGGLNPALSTPQGQLASSETAIIGDAYALFTWFCNQVDPAFSSGRMQDGIARIYFIERIAAQATVVVATCTGLQGVQIPVGALARATDERLYVCQEAGTISASGTIDLTFAGAETGPIVCPPGSLNVIYQTVAGWDTIDNAADGVLGRNVETRSEFEERRSLSTGLNSMGPLPAVLAAVLTVDGVLDAYAVENSTHNPLTIGGVLLGPNSIFVCVLGGDQQEVGEAIWSRKMPGCGYTGDTTVIVQDPSPEYIPPVPTYTVLFERPTIVEFVVLVVLSSTLGQGLAIPDDALTQVQAAIVAAFAGADGGSRARIGSTVFASRYYGPVAAIAPWSRQIIDLKVGIKGTAADIIGSISGSTLTVSSVDNGVLAIGSVLQGSGAMAGSGVVQGTSITSMGSATGGVGTYGISPAQTVGSSSMIVTAMLNAITVNIDQAPAISTADVMLALRP